jgi:penicillin-binding protein 1C
MKIAAIRKSIIEFANRTRARRILSRALVLLFLLFFLLKIMVWLSPVPAKKLEVYAESVRIYDRDGTLLREAVNTAGARAAWVSYEEITPQLVAATLAAEDKRFYQHGGIDLYAMFRAFRQLFSKQRIVSGASTISMQLARLLYGHHRTWGGKIAQAFNALRIERTLSKNEILEQYLNRVFYGAGAIGIEAASKQYFGKPNQHLSPAEAALLAGLIQAPSRYNPFNGMEQAKSRQESVLELMHVNGQISQDEYHRATVEQIVLNTSREALTAMHFTDYVIQEAQQIGDIHTTLNYNLQVQTEKLVAEHVHSFQAGGLTNASVIVLDNETGDILTMVGSSDYWRGENGSVNGATALRQPGSALKPFTYALAFEAGKTPATVVPDIETEYIGMDGDLYIPRNYSETFYGPVLMKHALGRSLNIAAIRTLNMVGIDSLLSRLAEAGISSLTEEADHYGLGLTLGNGEVTLLELAQAYSCFPRKGWKNTAHFLADSVSTDSTKIFSEKICFLITDILRDEKLRIQAFGAANPLLFDFPIAIKTGTSANFRDNWVVGYTDKYTIAVWAGDFEGEPMNQFSGSVGAGPLFNKIANLVIRHKIEKFRPRKQPLMFGIEQILVCPLSGGSPTENCPNYEAIHVMKEQHARPPCHVHQLIKVDKRNGLLASDHCPSTYTEEKVFEVLPPEYSSWQAKNNREAPPSTYSSFCEPDRIASHALVITSPLDGDIYLIEPGYDRKTQSIEMKGEVDPALPRIDWYVNGKKYLSAEWPYTAFFNLTKGKHKIEMVGGDMRSDAIEIEVR